MVYIFFEDVPIEVVNLYVVLVVVCGTCGENYGGVDGNVDVSAKNHDSVDGHDGDSSVCKYEVAGDDV